jgi:hypothetical protein
MKWLLSLLLLGLALAPPARADDFTSRAAAGRAASQNGEGSKYDLSLLPILKQAGDACDPLGTKLPPSEIGHFALIGNITDTGQMIDIEVRPKTQIAICFANQMSTAQFSTPPLYGRPTYPVVVDLNVTP